MTTVPAERVAEIFVEVADTLVDEFDLIDFLHMLTTRAAALVNAAAVGLVLDDQQGDLAFLAGSDENVRLVELVEVQNGEGPCLDAFRTGTPVINVDLRRATGRWPHFAPRAAAAGYRCAHAFPLRLRERVIGALTVFSDTTGKVFTGTEVVVLQALADIATIALLQERGIRRGEQLSEQLQGALNSRIAIEQAKGVVAQARGVSVDEAFTLMRTYSRNHHQPLRDLAHQVIGDLAAVPELSGP